MRLFIRVVVLLAVGMTVARPAGADGKPYTLKDLQALDQRQSWQELLAHLQDLPPADRGAEWNRVVEHACIQPGQMEGYLAENCLEALKSVLASEPQNQDFAWKAGKWARINLASWAAVPFFNKALAKAQDARCKDVDVSRAVVSGLGLPADTNKDVLSQAQTLAFGTCWPATKEAVMKEFAEGNGYFLSNTCPSLKQKGALSGDQLKMCAAKQQ